MASYNNCICSKVYELEAPLRAARSRGARGRPLPEFLVDVDSLSF